MSESMTMTTTNKKQRLVRYALVAAVTAAVSFPLVSQRLRAQDGDGGAAASQAEAEPRQADEQAEQPRPTGRAAGNADQDQPEDGQAQQQQPAASDADQPAPDAQGRTGQKGAAAFKGKGQGEDAKAGTGAAQADPDKVIASAGDIELTAGQFDSFLAGLPAQDQAQIRMNADAKRQIADHLIKMKALQREAERRKLDEDPKVQEQIDTVRKQLEAQIEVSRMQLLAQALVNTLRGDEATDKAYFEEHKDEFGKVQARHILVSTRGSNDPKNPKPPLSDAEAKKKADEIRARLEKGEDFAAVAKAESDDPGGKETGGSYTFGRVGEQRMVPAFEKAAYALKENEISQPVKTQFGYHVIQLQKRLPATYEEVKAAIGQHRLESFIKELTGGGDPKFDDAFFTAAPPPELPGGAGAGAGGARPGAGRQQQQQQPAGAGNRSNARPAAPAEKGAGSRNAPQGK